jgi:HSP20 family protein
MRTLPVPSLFDRLVSEMDAMVSTGSLSPKHVPTDLVEYADRYELLADLPGVEREAVEIEVADGVLDIRARRDPPTTEGAVRVLREERSRGTLHFRVALGAGIAVGDVGARLTDGVLCVVLPKSEQLRTRNIPVTVN